MEYTVFGKDEFRNRYGYELDLIIPNDHDSSSKVARAIQDVTEKIKEHIQQNSFNIDFTNLSEEQNNYINKAAMEQLVWEIKNGDFSREAGYNAITGALLPFTEIAKREIAPNAKRILNNHIITRCF